MTSDPTQPSCPFLSEQEVQRLALRYGPENDTDALAAGSRLYHGSQSLGDLLTINRWKNATGRNTSRLLINDTPDVLYRVAKACEMCEANHWAAALDVLVGLHGVAYPTASAYLAMVLPISFPIVDFRALNSVGMSGASADQRNTRTLVQHCPLASKALGVSIRDYDRALWQLDVERSSA